MLMLPAALQLTDPFATILNCTSPLIALFVQTEVVDGATVIIGSPSVRPPAFVAVTTTLRSLLPESELTCML
jgi:hypothetical protein